MRACPRWATLPASRCSALARMDVAGRHGVLVLMPPTAATDPNSVVGVVVPADCDATHARSLADTVVKYPVKRP